MENIWEREKLYYHSNKTNSTIIERSPISFGMDIPNVREIKDEVFFYNCQQIENIFQYVVSDDNSPDCK